MADVPQLTDSNVAATSGPPRPVLIATGFAVIVGAYATLAGLLLLLFYSSSLTSLPPFSERVVLAIGVLMLVAGPNLALGSRLAAIFVGAVGGVGLVFGLVSWSNGAYDGGDWLAQLTPRLIVLSCAVAPIAVIAGRRYFTTWSLPGPWPVVEWAVVIGAVAFALVPAVM